MTMIFVLLYLLAITDGAFCGYRAAAGRSALIFKRTYYVNAMIRGILWTHVAVAIAALAAGISMLLCSSPTELFARFTHAGKYVLQVYLSYAAVISVAFAFRAINSVDIRSLTSTLIFGPLTLLRPIVAVIGGVWAIFKVPRIEIAIMVSIVLVMMLYMESFLRRKYYQWSE